MQYYRDICSHLNFILSNDLPYMCGFWGLATFYFWPDCQNATVFFKTIFLNSAVGYIFLLIDIISSKLHVFLLKSNVIGKLFTILAHIKLWVCFCFVFA